MKHKVTFIRIVAFVTLFCGAANLYTAITPHRPARYGWLLHLLPLEFLRFPRSWTLMIGFALIFSSVNIWRRKQRAIQIVLSLSAFSALFHLLKGHNYEESLLSLLLMGLLLLLRQEFTVKSRQPDWRSGLIKLALGLLAALCYGASGFWLLDVREFGVNFHWLDAVRQRLRCQLHEIQFQEKEETISQI